MNKLELGILTYCNNFTRCIYEALLLEYSSIIRNLGNWCRLLFPPDNLTSDRLRTYFIALNLNHPCTVQ